MAEWCPVGELRLPNRDAARDQAIGSGKRQAVARAGDEQAERVRDEGRAGGETAIVCPAHGPEQPERDHPGHADQECRDQRAPPADAETPTTARLAIGLPPDDARVEEAAERPDNELAEESPADPQLLQPIVATNPTE